MITVSLVYRQRKPLSVRNNSDITASRPDLIGERLQRRDYEGSAQPSKRLVRWVSSSGALGVAANSRSGLLASDARPDLLVSASGPIFCRRLRVFWLGVPALLAGRTGAASLAAGVTWRLGVRAGRGRSNPRPARCEDDPVVCGTMWHGWGFLRWGCVARWGCVGVSVAGLGGGQEPGVRKRGASRAGRAGRPRPPGHPA